MADSGINGISGFNSGAYKGSEVKQNSKNIQYFDPHNPNAYNLAYMNARDNKPNFNIGADTYMKAYETKPADRNIFYNA